jgi:hypothetical protein
MRIQCNLIKSGVSLNRSFGLLLLSGRRPGIVGKSKLIECVTRFEFENQFDWSGTNQKDVLHGRLAANQMAMVRRRTEC